MGVWLGLPVVAHALPAGIVPSWIPVADPSTLCEAAVNMAQGIAHTPPGLLNAIATVESGQHDPATGRWAPWPWTIDANGAGHTYTTEAEAIAAAQGFEAENITSLDVGCMQINLQHHPDAFTSLAQAFDPAANAIYGAQFLRRLKSQLGGWNPAVGAYHSETPALGLPYEQKVLAVWHDQGGPVPTLIPAAVGMSAIPKPATRPAKPTDGAIALRHFGVGGFAFAGMRGHAEILPIAVPAGASETATAPGGIGGRSLAAYRSDPIPITGAK